jgi:two-component system NtrC family sensor kinase
MKSASILYIEDNDQDREQLTSLLVSRGYAVRTAATGQDGLGAIASETPDVIVCDLNMPGLNGIEVLSRSRAIAPEVPFLILSGTGTIPRAVEAIKEGADDFIRKPVDINELLLSIENALERRHLALELSRYTENVESVVRERTEDLQIAAAQLFQLNLASHRLAQIRDEDTFFDEVPGLVCEALGFDGAVVGILEGGELKIRCSHTAKDPLVCETLSENSPTLMARCSEVCGENRTIVVRDPADDTLPRKGGASRGGDGRDTVIAPIRLDEEPIGVIAGSIASHDRETNDQDVARFEMFAVMAGLALRNIRAYQRMEMQVRERTRELEDNAIALASANVELLGAQELLEEKNRELQKAEERMVAIMEASPIPLVATRVSDGRILYANQHLGKLVGAEAKDLIGRKSPDFYHNALDRNVVLEKLERDGFLRSHEVLMKRADGSPIWMLMSIVQTELAGEPAIIGGLYDIDERKKAEAALQESEELFRGIVEGANDIIFTLSPDQQISYVSPNIAELLGYSVSEVVGRGLEPFVHEADMPRLIEFYRGIAETGERRSNFEYRVRHKNGTIRWYSLNASIIKDEAGVPQYFVGIAHDFTERKNFIEKLEQAHEDLTNAQSQLVQSEKMAALGMLVAGIAHEINTPIGAVNSMHDTLLRSVDKLRGMVVDQCKQEPEKVAHFDKLFTVIADSNKVISSGVERVTTIVRRLRSFARLDEAELKEVDINEGIEDTLTLVHHEMKHDITIEKKYGDIPPFSCFPGRLNQVLLNLLVNARQAIEGKGTIEIETKMEGHDLIIRVSDSGVGIPKEHLQRIFDPGFTTKGVGVGTGLGLSICFQIIEDHHGKMTVESEVGKGTTFTLRIPDNLSDFYDEGGKEKKKS